MRNRTAALSLGMPSLSSVVCPAVTGVKSCAMALRPHTYDPASQRTGSRHVPSAAELANPQVLLFLRPHTPAVERHSACRSTRRCR